MGCIRKFERYFNLRGVQKEVKMEALMEGMEGIVLSCFQWWEACNPNQSWFGLNNALIQRVQLVLMGNPFKLLLALKQKEFSDRIHHPI